MKQLTAHYIDIAVNLIGSSLEKDIDGVISQAEQHGVSPLIVIGSDLLESERVIECCSQYPKKLYATAGVHPHQASQWSKTSRQKLISLAQSPSVVAIGECGLDYNRDYSPRSKQRAAFEEQLAIAVELQLPVLMHERDAHDDFIAILSQYRDTLPKALLHCFTGDRDSLLAYRELDLYLGITGWICDERRGQELAELVVEIPSNRLLLETDSPYLLPRGMKPKPKSGKNQPQYLPYIAQQVAKLREEDHLQFAQQIYSNSIEFFNLPIKMI